MSDENKSMLPNVAAMAATSFAAYKLQEHELKQYDRALGIDPNLPPDVRARLRNQWFESRGQKPPASARRAVLNMWLWSFAILFTLYLLAALAVEVF
jgi:hypothetical protein